MPPDALCCQSGKPLPWSPTRFGCSIFSGTVCHTQRSPLEHRTSKPVQCSKGLSNAGTRPGKA